MSEMTPEEQTAELEELYKRTFDLANSFAGDETGHLAVTLHQSANLISLVLASERGG